MRPHEAVASLGILTREQHKKQFLQSLSCCAITLDGTLEGGTMCMEVWMLHSSVRTQVQCGV